MGSNFTVGQIGILHANGEGFCIELYPEYREALTGLEGFSHVNILWWFSGCDDERSRSVLSERTPYRGGPEVLGTFATRSPRRPNPLALSCAGIVGIDRERGLLYLDYVDAQEQSPVLDLKPYTSSLDRVESPEVPDWCANWPGSVETSGDFDWEAVFRFQESSGSTEGNPL